MRIKRVGKLSIWFNAWRDARNNHPGLDEGPEGNFIGELKEIADADISQLTEKFDHKKRILTEQIERFNSEIANLSEDLPVQIQRYGESRKSADWNSKWTYLGLFVVLLIETPLNIAAFRFLGEAEIFTIGLAFGLSCCLAILVHFAGKGLRVKEPSSTDRILTLTAIGMICLAVLGVAVFRHLLYVHKGNEANLLIDVGFVLIQFTFLYPGVLLTYSAYDPVATLRAKINERRMGIQICESARDTLPSFFSNQIVSVINEVEGRITYYAKINRRHRKEKSQIPKLFLNIDSLVKYEISKELTNSLTANKAKSSGPWAA